MREENAAGNARNPIDRLILQKSVGSKLISTMTAETENAANPIVIRFFFVLKKINKVVMDAKASRLANEYLK